MTSSPMHEPAGRPMGHARPDDQPIGRQRILLVDDDPVGREELKACLASQGYTIATAGSVPEAAVAAREHADGIILDLTSADRRDVELCRMLRRQQVASPILMLSVLSTTADKVAGLDAGADDYLTKPFQLAELMARLRCLLRRSSLATTRLELRAGDLVMDLHEHRVTLGGSPVKLSGREFALLEYMMRNPDRLLTRAMISECVWDMNYQPGSNVIEVYVSSLRRKVQRGSHMPQIETVIGSGYRFLGRSKERAFAPEIRSPEMTDRRRYPVLCGREVG